LPGAADDPAGFQAGALKEIAEHEFRVTLGRDFAGVVEEIGSAADRYRVGDAVFGFVPQAGPTGSASA
jgi:NADPH2:quinone reductase